MDQAHGQRMTIAVQLNRPSRGDWDADGWVLLTAFLPPGEIAALGAEAERLLADRTLFEVRGAVPNSPTRNDRLDPVIDLSPPFAELARSEKLTALVRGALGGEPQLMKDKFIAKPPGAAGYGTHQDGAYWPGMGFDVGRFLTAILFLDDSPSERGPIECASGHHRCLLTDPDAVADVDETGLGPFEVIEAQAGDLLLLHALTPHRSGPNGSAAMRRALMFTYGVDPRPDLYGVYSRARQA